MRESEYGLEVVFHDETSFGDVVSIVTKALAEEGFGVLTEIDVKATFAKKLNVEHRPYVILGACNPKLAHAAIEAEPGIGLLLPCNVVVQDNGEGGVAVSIVNPRAMFQVVQNDGLDEVVSEVDAKLRRVAAALES